MEYIDLNREGWNKRTEAHLEGDFYEMDKFLAGKNSLHQIELDLLGNVCGKRILHLQCHFGQDSLSLARMGAQVTAMDLSDVAIEKAKSLNDELGLNAKFICCPLLDLPNHLEEQFDLVFTSYGVISWHPELSQWGNLIAKYLAPGGKFIIAEFHPMVWMFDEAFEKITYSYFNDQAFKELIGQTYGSDDVFIDHHDVSWNHSIHNVIMSLVNAGLKIEHFQEYPYSPYDLFGKSTEVRPGQFVPDNFEGKVPLIFSIGASRNT